MEGSAGGRPSGFRRGSGEDIVRDTLLLRRLETLRLEIEHRPIAPSGTERHQLVVRAELDHLAVLQHADAIGVAYCRKAVRDEDGRALPGGAENAIKNLRLPAHVELGRGLV